MTLRLHTKLFQLITLSILSFALQAQRQEYLSGLRALPLSFDEKSASTAKNNAVLNLPFVDDFSYPSSVPDPNKWEISDVWVNQTWAVNPITLGFASFDGLNRYGRPHKEIAKDTICDILSSQTINLASPTDSVYLSFYYQAGGWGEMPSFGSDSLVLQFWNALESKWESTWANDRYPNSYFKNVMIYVPNRYHQANFKFRFLNYGASNGALDLWHVDYVYLDDQRTYNDSIPNDISFTQPHPSLLINYESIPWWHVNQAFNIQSIFKKEVDLHYRRNRRLSTSKPNLNLGFYQVSLNGNLLQKQINTSATLEQTHLPNEETVYTIPQIGEPRLNFVNPPYQDEFEFESYHTFNGVNFDIPENDTIRRKQVFKNYYAYDDGSAERAYEIRNNRGGFIVQRYDVLVNDTLKGLQIYFQPALYDLEDQEFTILMLSNATGLPSSIIYESDSVYTAQYTDGNFYQTYMLDTTLQGPITSGTVFIGIRQKNSEPLSLGYDQNNRGFTTAFYGELNDMYQSFLGGTIMMRPVFRYAPRDLSVDDLQAAESMEIYPNPNQGNFQIKLPLDLRDLEGAEFVLHNLSGQELGRYPVAENLSCSHLPKGIYLLRLEAKDRFWQTKILIQ